MKNIIFQLTKKYGIATIFCLSMLPLVNAQIEIDFGTTGRLVGGTPLGNGPGWIHYAANGTRWDAYTSNNGYQIIRNGTDNQLFFANDGRLGIRKFAPGKMIDVDAGTPSSNEGLRVLHTSGYGAALLANNALLGGWFVTNGGSSYAPIWAHSFNVMTNPANARSRLEIQKSNYSDYVTQFSNLNVIEYFSHSEDRSVLPHIGIDAVSAPDEMITYAPGDPNELIHSSRSINLADWTGLNTVIIKYLLEENKQLLKEIDAIKAEIKGLKEHL